MLKEYSTRMKGLHEHLKFIVYNSLENGMTVKTAATKYDFYEIFPDEEK